MVYSSSIKAFIKKSYLEIINYQDLISEYINYLNDKVSIESPYIYDDGISKKHFLELLNEYMFLYVRLYIMKNFSLINQPYLEDIKSSLMGKKYSVYYEAVSTPKAKNFEFINEAGNKIKIQAEEKVECPITDWTIIYQSESDTWSNNLNSAVTQFIKEHHLRDWKAYYGHSYEQVYYIQICHDSNRMNKQLRELDSFYINVLQRVEYMGASKRVLFLKFFQKIFNFFSQHGEVKLDNSNNNVIYKRQNKINYYLRLYKATGDDKYLFLIEKIKDKELKKTSKFYDWCNKNNEKIIQKIEQLQHKYGTIRINATISDQPSPVNLKETTLKQLLNRDTPLYHESYRVDFYFNMTDTMGRYNHKYMGDVLESRAIKSTTSFDDVKCWNKSMVISKEDMLDMGYPAGINLYNISDEEVYSRWYKSDKGE